MKIINVDEEIAKKKMDMEILAGGRYITEEEDQGNGNLFVNSGLSGVAL